MDKKEEVLDIQLTPHGKYLLSLGKLKPVYYSFHDSNILYDGRYADVSENTQQTEDRIQHNTPQAKTVASRVSREQNVKRIFEPRLSLATDLKRAAKLASVSQMNEQRIFLTDHPLGSCSPTTDLAPKWSVKVLNGEITNSTPYLSSDHQILQIPQIDISVVYKTAVLNSDSEAVLPLTPDPALSSERYKDGTYIAIDPDHLLLEVLEENTEYNKNNFEVEVFEVSDEIRQAAKSGLSGASTTSETMETLFFRQPIDEIQNNILLDPSEQASPPSIGDNNSMVDYYFNVLVDHEIDPSDLCEAKTELKSKNLFVDLDIECSPSDLSPTRYDVYTSPTPTEACPVPEKGTSCDD